MFKEMLATVYNCLDGPISNFWGVRDILFPFMEIPVLNANKVEVAKTFSLKCLESMCKILVRKIA